MTLAVCLSVCLFARPAGIKRARVSFDIDARRASSAIEISAEARGEYGGCLLLLVIFICCLEGIDGELIVLACWDYNVQC